jgi:hypothetical protein
VSANSSHLVSAGVSPASLFPDEDYRFQIRFDRGAPADFFRPTNQHQRLLSERRHWLATSPETYSALLPEGHGLLEETIALAREWETLPSDFPALAQAEAAPGLVPNTPPGSACVSPARFHHLNRSLGMAWESDFLVMEITPAASVRLVGGCVCFPSSWSLEEKLGKPIELIHEVVPALNPAIGPQIHSLLTKLKPEVARLRSNWGLSRSSELNQHPSQKLPRLDETVSLEEVWLRIENQALVSLPVTKGVLFGIRIVMQPLAAICQDEATASRLARALRTMPDEMVRYKGLDRARGRLLTLIAESPESL